MEFDEAIKEALRRYRDRQKPGDCQNANAHRNATCKILDSIDELSHTASSTHLRTQKTQMKIH